MRSRRLGILGTKMVMSSRGEVGNTEGNGAARVVWNASGNRSGVKIRGLKKEEWVMKAMVVEVRVTCY